MGKVGISLALFALSLAQAQSPTQDAEAAFRAGDLNRAAVLARQALAGDPNSVQAHILLGVSASETRDWSTATQNFEAVIRLAPSSSHGYFYLGQANLYQQKWAEAAKYFASALQRNYPDRERLIVELAFAENEAGRPRGALDRLVKIQPPQAGPLAAQYFAVTAFARNNLNQPLEAIQAMQRAKEVDDLNPQYREFLVSTLLNTSQPGLALAEAIDAQKRFPDQPEVQFLFGLAAYNMSNRDLIRIALRNLSEAAPAGAQEVLLQGMVHRLAGEREQATQEFLQAAKRGVPDSHLLLGLVLKDSGDLDGAAREFGEAERVSPTNGQVEVELGKILLSRGRLSEAALRLKKAEQYMPTVAAVHYELARLYARLGQKEKSSQHLQKFKELQGKQADQANAPVR